MSFISQIKLPDGNTYDIKDVNATSNISSLSSSKLNTNGNGSNVTTTFSTASSRSNINSGESLTTLFGKIKKWFSDLQSTAFTSIASIQSTILNAAYPIGSIYISINNTNPSTYFGGTWVAWGSGRVPVGVNTSDSNFNTVEKTGGSSNVTLSVSQMPTHSHEFIEGVTWHWGTSSGNIYMDGVTVRAGQSPSTGNPPFSMQNTWVRTQNSGEGGSHTNLQPYITCYMWKRTA